MKRTFAVRTCRWWDCFECGLTSDLLVCRSAIGPLAIMDSKALNNFNCTCLRHNQTYRIVRTAFALTVLALLVAVESVFVWLTHTLSAMSEDAKAEVLEEEVYGHFFESVDDGEHAVVNEMIELGVNVELQNEFVCAHTHADLM